MVDFLGAGLSGVITLVAAFGGIYLGGANQRRADDRAADREDAQHRREVAARIEDERHRDQLDLLRTAQEETVETARASIALIFAAGDLRQEGADDSALPEHFRTQQYEARTNLALHASRILEDDLRTALEAFVNEVTDASIHSNIVLQSGTLEEAGSTDERRVHRIDKQHEEIVEALGAAIRSKIAGSAKSHPHALPE